MMGKEVRLPLSLLFPIVDYTNDSEPEKYARELQERLANFNKLARYNMQQRQRVQKMKYDNRVVRSRHYSVGDEVWVRLKVIPREG